MVYRKGDIAWKISFTNLVLIKLLRIAFDKPMAADGL